MFAFFFCIFFNLFQIKTALELKKDDFTDYCEWFGEDEIQGRKHGFMAGNYIYYYGGRLAWDRQHETVGLTHPFYHDLRSRGTGISYYEGVGTGNDFSGWEFYKDTKVAYGTIITDEMRWVEPSPKHMYWRPDKIIVEYELTSPYLEGVFLGWCTNWNQGATNGSDSFWVHLTEQECWDHCNADDLCFQAVYEDGGDPENSQCWIGLNKLTEEPTASRCPTCRDKCYAKPIHISPVHIREEKFISLNDVVSTTIMAQCELPVTLEISGRSFTMDDGIVSLNGRCSFDQNSNTIRVIESGKVIAKVMESPVIEQEATLMYEGMSSALSASKSMENVTIYEVSRGVCGYMFSIPLDDQEVTISWSMNDDWSKALEAVQDTLKDPANHLMTKTNRMNDMLNSLIPYFRCSDQDIIKVYYYLWSLYLMYYTPGNGDEMQKQPHTQTAVNNFLGMHRYDAVFQIPVSSWISPAEHDFYANGNVLSWSDVLPYRKGEQLPDNFGTTWGSGVYGPEMIAHIVGAWQIYEHSGNKTFLGKAYDFYKELFWDNIGGNHWNYGYDSMVCMEKMAEILGHTDDIGHWNASINMNGLEEQNNQEFWEIDTPKLFAGGADGIGFTNFANTAYKQFPRELLDIMAREWLDNPMNGLAGKVPLSTIALKDHPGKDIVKAFKVVPDSNWYVLSALYKHNINGLANKYTLEHLKKYNMEWGIPSATEGRHLDESIFGDRYSNFNAGKILLIIEGIGGIKYSMHEDSFTYSENLPKEWSFMEFHIPVISKKADSEEITWVKTRSERRMKGDKIIKIVEVESNPFKKLIVQPWLEGLKMESANSKIDGKQIQSFGEDVMWEINNEKAHVTITLQ